MTFLRGVWTSDSAPSRYSVRVYHDGRTVHVATFNCALVAAVVFDVFSLNRFGQYAQTNLPAGDYNLHFIKSATFEGVLAWARRLAEQDVQGESTDLLEASSCLALLTLAA